MERDLPSIFQDVSCTVHDFNTSEELASGRCDIKFIEHTDRLRVRRHLFEGLFVPASEAETEALKQHLIARLSLGAPAHLIYLDHGGQTYAFTVKFELGDLAFPFTGRAEPKAV